MHGGQVASTPDIFVSYLGNSSDLTECVIGKNVAFKVSSLQIVTSLDQSGTHGSQFGSYCYSLVSIRLL